MSYIFTWVPVYQAIAEKLEKYAGRGNELADILTQLGVETSDEEIPGQRIQLDDIDPISFISCLNKFGDERALSVLRELCSIWQIPHKVYDVAGIPRTSGMKAYLFPYKRERQENEIYRLWQFFLAYRKGTLNDTIVANVLSIKGVAWPKLTEGLFMIDPNRNLCLNGMVRPYLEAKGIPTQFSNYTEMLSLLDTIKAKLSDPFYKISHDSYRASELTKQPPQFWRIGTTAGQDGKDILPEMLSNEVASIGWEVLGNLTNIQPFNQGNIRDKLVELRAYENRQTASVKAGEIFNFKEKIHINDYIVACKGGTVRAIGQVLHGQYIYNQDFDFPHCRAVEWIKRDVKDLSIAGTQQSVNVINHTIDIENLKTYLFGMTTSATSTPNQEAQIKQIPSLNTIFYGPPGTGKTFHLQKLFESFTDVPKQVTSEDKQAAWLKESTWWEVLAYVLYHLPQGATVPQLKQQPFIAAKFAQSDIKNTSQRLWGTLQHHTVAECKSVALERRLSPPIFWKDNNSVWRLNNKEDFAGEYPELVAGPNEVPSSKQINKYKRYLFTTAHQSWSYEDFVEGIKPRLSQEADGDEAAESGLGYHHKDGLFYEACNEAARLAGFKNLQDCLRASKEDREKAFVDAPRFALFIDEINRANISAVMGELITLIEDDKRLGSRYEISDTRLPYSRRLFGVPANLHIIGTMNTADRSVEALDTALRRRFSFKEMLPDYNKLNNSDGSDKQIDGLSIKNLLVAINKRLTYLKDRDHQIGHSYLMDVADEASLRTTFANKIIPLLQEYFYNDYAGIRLVLGDAFVEQEPETDVPIFAVDDEQPRPKQVYQLKIPDNIVDALKKTINPMLQN